MKLNKSISRKKISANFHFFAISKMAKKSIFELGKIAKYNFTKIFNFFTKMSNHQVSCNLQRAVNRQPDHRTNDSEGTLAATATIASVATCSRDCHLQIGNSLIFLHFFTFFKTFQKLVTCQKSWGAPNFFHRICPTCPLHYPNL